MKSPWRLSATTSFRNWMYQLNFDDKTTLSAALTTMTETVSGPWELKHPRIGIFRLADKFPTIYRLELEKAIVPIGILYGLSGNCICIGAWGTLHTLKQPATIQNAQSLIATMGANS